MKYDSWLQNYPHLLEQLYGISVRCFTLIHPLIRKLGYQRVDSWLSKPEHWAKKAVFGCEMCGQCILQSTGMTCSMICPKNLRNGPCGGVRSNGHCEVIPDMKCVWVNAYERSREMPLYGDKIFDIQPPLDRQLEGTSAWINLLTGDDRDVPDGWHDVEVTSENSG